MYFSANWTTLGPVVVVAICPKLSEDYVDGVGEIHVVEQVEELGPELQPLAFRDWNELHDGEVRVDLFRSSYDVPS